MNKQYVIMSERGGAKVFLCNGGGSFSWWTVHKSMASKVPAEKARLLAASSGGKAYQIRV
jgi:hypothetical protein